MNHLLEEINSRFNEDHRARAQILALVPAAMVRHDSLHDVAEKLPFWQLDLPTPPSLQRMAILLETKNIKFTLCG